MKRVLLILSIMAAVILALSWRSLGAPCDGFDYFDNVEICDVPYFDWALPQPNEDSLFVLALDPESPEAGTPLEIAVHAVFAPQLRDRLAVSVGFLDIPEQEPIATFDPVPDPGVAWLGLAPVESRPGAWGLWEAAFAATATLPAGRYQLFSRTAIDSDDGSTDVFAGPVLEVAD